MILPYSQLKFFFYMVTSRRILVSGLAADLAIRHLRSVFFFGRSFVYIEIFLSNSRINLVRELIELLMQVRI